MFVFINLELNKLFFSLSLFITEQCNLYKTLQSSLQYHHESIYFIVYKPLSQYLKKKPKIETKQKW